jgi:hypothetical protein
LHVQPVTQENAKDQWQNLPKIVFSVLRSSVAITTVRQQIAAPPGAASVASPTPQAPRFAEDFGYLGALYIAPAVAVRASDAARFRHPPERQRRMFLSDECDG